MEALLTLNIFTMYLPAALLGMGLFGSLLMLPLFLGHELRCSHPAKGRGPAH